MSSVSTSIPPQPHVNPFAVVPKEMIWRLRVDQYHQMIRNGILTADDQVELLEGMLVNKMAKNPPHRIATHRTMKALERVIPASWYVDTQEPVTLEDSEPEPDVMVARGETESKTALRCTRTRSGQATMRIICNVRITHQPMKCPS
jgi:Putative restriction endonuclease